MPILNFLTAEDGTPLTKTFRRLRSGAIEKSPYPHAQRFTSESLSTKSLRSTYDILRAKAPTGACLLKGNIKRPLVNESRAGSTTPNEATSYLALDADSREHFASGREFLQTIGLSQIAFIEQLSSSTGIVDTRGYSAHLFIMLRNPVPAPKLKLWLQWLNLTYLEEFIELNKAGHSLRWPLDISTCQNDKLIYIADPVCINFDPPDIDRWSLHDLRNKTLDFSFDDEQSVEVEAKRIEVLNARRSAAGLPRRTYSFSKAGIMKNPEPTTVTGCREERGFVYLNLNGGDSWGYYFPSNNPEILYNFKGEPPVKLKTVAPEFYDTIVEPAEPPSDEEPADFHGKTYEVGVDTRSSNYMCITYDHDADEVEVDYTRARVQAMDFMKEHGRDKPDFIPRWKVLCDFTSPVRVDFERRILNQYRPTQYLLNAKKGQTIPPTIDRVLRHVFAYDEAVLEHFLNWLAVIFQHKRMTYTAWVIGGTQGTGKGLLFDRILTPLLGPQHCAKTTLLAFEDKYNGFLENRLLLFVDEVQISSVRRQEQAMANLKKDMANSPIDIRRMFCDTYMIENFINVILASNKFDALQVDPDDRRFNVAPRQEAKLMTVMSLKNIEAKIEAELQEFANYLMHREADIDTAREILDTDERRRLMRATENLTQSVANAIRHGNLDFFIENLRDTKETLAEFQLATRMASPVSIKEVLRFMYDHRGQECRMPRDYLAVLFYYTCDIAKPTAHAFSKFLGYHGFDLRVIGFNNSTCRGVIIPRINIEDERAYLTYMGAKLEVRDGGKADSTSTSGARTKR